MVYDTCSSGATACLQGNLVSSSLMAIARPQLQAGVRPSGYQESEMFPWTKDRPNLLSPDNIAKIRAELERGIIFCHQYYFCGGRGRDEWAFNEFVDFMNHISRARAGDSFAVWSVSTLLENDVALASARYTPQAQDETLMLTASSLQRIKSYLRREYSEINAVFHCPSVAQPMKTNTYESDYFDEFLADLRTYSRPGGEVYVFTEEDIYAQRNILIEAKYPNERGEVPIGGAY